MYSQSTVQKCRVCNSEMPVIPGYTTWCGHCGWNIDGKGQEKKNTLERFYDYLGKKWSENLLNSVKNEVKIINRISITKIAALLLSLPIYFIQILFLIAYLAFAILFVHNFKFDITVFITSIAIVLVIPVIVIIKKIREQQKIDEYLKDSVVSKDKFPALYTMVNKISDYLGVTEVDGIIIDEDFNASFGRYGIKKKKILTIGLPLFSILGDKEKVALISHEIAHDVNNDALIGRISGKALDILGKWYLSVAPNEIMAAVFSRFPIAILLIPFYWIISKIILLYWYLLSIISWRDSQCAEYYADYLSSTVSGSEEMISTLEKLYYSSSFYSTADNIIRYNDKNILNSFLERIKNVPQRELERIKRLIVDKQSQIDSTHPPTVFRIEFLKSKYNDSCNLCNDIEYRIIEEELKSKHEEIECRIKQYYHID